MNIQNHKKATKPCKHNLHMSDGIWTYRVGKRFIIMKPPDLMKTYKMTFEEYSSDPKRVDKTRWYYAKCWHDETGVYGSPFDIKPSDVKGLIENILAAGESDEI